MKKLSNDHAGIGTIAIALIVIVILVGSGAGVYFIINNDEKDSNDNGNDIDTDELFSIDMNEPNINGNMGIESVFTYTATYANNTNITTTNTDITAYLNGQSGSYYLYIFYVSPLSLGAVPIMLHKSTGEMRLGTYVGTDSINYNGKNIALSIYEQELNGDIFYISSTSDGIPYKFSFETNRTNSNGEVSTSKLSGTLLSTDIKPSTPYIKPDRFGESYHYSYSDDRSSNHGTISLMVIGNYLDYSAESRQLLIMVYFSLKDNNGDSTQTCTYIHDLESSSVWLVSQYHTYSGVETINTFEGNVECNVYEDSSDKAYIGKANGIMYLYITDYYSGSYGTSMKLISYTVP